MENRPSIPSRFIPVVDLLKVDGKCRKFNGITLDLLFWILGKRTYSLRSWISWWIWKNDTESAPSSYSCCTRSTARSKRRATWTGVCGLPRVVYPRISPKSPYMGFINHPPYGRFIPGFTTLLLDFFGGQIKCQSQYQSWHRISLGMPQEKHVPDFAGVGFPSGPSSVSSSSTGSRTFLFFPLAPTISGCKRLPEHTETRQGLQHVSRWNKPLWEKNGKKQISGKKN